MSELALAIEAEAKRIEKMLSEQADEIESLRAHIKDLEAQLVEARKGHNAREPE